MDPARRCLPSQPRIAAESARPLAPPAADSSRSPTTCALSVWGMRARSSRRTMCPAAGQLAVGMHAFLVIVIVTCCSCAGAHANPAPASHGSAHSAPIHFENANIPSYEPSASLGPVPPPESPPPPSCNLHCEYGLRLDTAMCACLPCTPCTPPNTRRGGCDGLADSLCGPCADCPPQHLETQPCTATTDRACQPRPHRPL